MQPTLFLQTQRVRLRQFTPHDHPLLLWLDSDPEVMRYLTGGRPSAPEQVQQGLNRILAARERFQGERGYWAAELIDTGRFIGWFLLRPGKHEPDNLRDLEVGYRLGREFWGRGLATEVSRALLIKAFGDPAVQSVFATTMKGNTRSWSVMKKLGMSFECEYVDDQFGSSELDVRYRITREAWELMQAATSA